MIHKRFYTAILILFLMISFSLSPVRNVSGNGGMIVDPNRVYSYESMTSDIVELAHLYPDIIEYKSIGATKYGRELWAVKLGKGNVSVFFNGSHHAREWMTTNLLMYMIDQYAIAYSIGSSFEGYDIRHLLEEVSIWFVPMVNPDGVTLQQSGLQAFPQEIHSDLVQWNNGSENFRRWKSNAEGIDLNRQYPAGWANLKETVYSPSYNFFKGSSPLAANEANTMAAFTWEINPEITVSYHDSGNVLYWYYENKPENLDRDVFITDSFAAITGYSIMGKSSGPQGGGYKDWFIQTFDRPGFTVEIGNYIDETNLPVSEFPEIWERNKNAGLFIAKEGLRLWYSRSRAGMYIDNLEQTLDPGAFLVGNRIYVPLRQVSEKLDAKIQWDSATNMAMITKDSTRITLKAWSQAALINGTPSDMGDKALFIQGKLMVPARFLAEALDAEITWEDTNRSIHLTVRK